MGCAIHGNISENQSQRNGAFSGWLNFEISLLRIQNYSSRVLLQTSSFQELLNMEKNRNVSLTDSKSNKKKGKSKKKEQNGSAGTSGEGGGGSGGKEKCQVM